MNNQRSKYITRGPYPKLGGGGAGAAGKRIGNGSWRGSLSQALRRNRI